MQKCMRFKENIHSWRSSQQSNYEQAALCLTNIKAAPTITLLH